MGPPPHGWVFIRYQRRQGTADRNKDLTDMTNQLLYLAVEKKVLATTEIYHKIL